MKKQLLVGELMIGINSYITASLSSLGFNVRRCRNHPDEYLQELAVSHYDGIIIFMMGENSEFGSLIKSIKATGRDIFVITVLFSATERTKKFTFEAGTDECIIMPVPVSELCQMICAAMADSRSTQYMREIASVFKKYGFPHYMCGFYYLCAAAELSLTSTDSVSSLSTVVYPYIARKMATDSQLVERSLRHYARALCKNNILKDFTGLDFDYVLSNKELISVVSDAIVLFLNKNDVPDKETPGKVNNK